MLLNVLVCQTTKIIGTKYAHRRTIHILYILTYSPDAMPYFIYVIICHFIRQKDRVDAKQVDT